MMKTPAAIKILTTVLLLCGIAHADAPKGPKLEDVSISKPVVMVSVKAPSGPVTWLGIATEDMSDKCREQLPVGLSGGLSVAYVSKNSPAATADIQQGDVLTLFNDQILFNPVQFKALVASHKAGDAVILTGYRNGKEFKVTASLQSKELSFKEATKLGLLLTLHSGPDSLSNFPPDTQKLIRDAIAGKAAPGMTLTAPSVKAHRSITVIGPDGKEMSSAALSDPATQKRLGDALAKLSPTSGSPKLYSIVTVVGSDGKVISSQKFSDQQSSMDPAEIREVVQEQLKLHSTASDGRTNAAPPRN